MTKTLAEMPKDVLSRCPHCLKANPVIRAMEIGQSTDSVMVAFVPECCRKILGLQMIAKPAETPAIN